MKINQQFTSLGIFALLGSVLSGCASQQSAVFAHSTEGSVLMSSSGPQAVADAEILDVFEELFGNAPATAPTQGNRVGPSLIAGDWLAHQCALAGGYWDMPHRENAPAFAEASEIIDPAE